MVDAVGGIENTCRITWGQMTHNTRVQRVVDDVVE